MPAIYLFQRRTLYGGDDLHLLALSTSAIRALQLLCYAILAYHILNHVAGQANYNARQYQINKSAAITTALSDEMYVRRRRRLVEQEDEGDDDYYQYNEQDDDNNGGGGSSSSSSSNNGDNSGNDDNNSVTFLNLGLSLLEYAWMDAVYNNNENDPSELRCRHSHLFPLLLIFYTLAGTVFGIGSLVLLLQIYRTSSMGCPTIDRQYRTIKMQQYLEWLFFPLNIIHFLIWLLGISTMILGFHYGPCTAGYVAVVAGVGSDNDGSNNDMNTDDLDNNNDDDNAQRQLQQRIQQELSTWFFVIVIIAGVILLISQGIEVIWNFAYILSLHHHDPHALVVPNKTGSGSYRSATTATTLNSTNGSSRNLLEEQPQQQQQQQQQQEDYYYEHHELVEQMWADRCQNCCRCLGMGTCYIFGGRELYGSGAMHYGDFARAMADYLETRGVLDVVPSDILVGFLVLQQVQSQRRLYMRNEVLSEAFSSSLLLNHSNHQPYQRRHPANSNNSNNSTQLNDHRATAKTPKGMRLQRASSQDALGNQLLGGVPSPAAAADSSSSPARITNGSDHLHGSSSLSKPPKRPVLLQSLGAGSMHHLSDHSSGKSPSSGGISAAVNLRTTKSTTTITVNNTTSMAATTTASSRSTTATTKVIVDQSLPPASPNHHKAIKIHTGSSAAPATSITAPLAPPAPAVVSAPPPFARTKSFQRLLNEHNHADVNLLEEGARYSKYALAIYSWYLYLYVNPITGLPKLCMKTWNSIKKKKKCCFLSHPRPERRDNNATIPNSSSTGNLHHYQQHEPSNNGSNFIGDDDVDDDEGWEGDNMCEAHKHALLLAAGIENEADLVYVNFKNSFNENPYCILLDHETEAVVVAVRGTFSLEDCVTDVLIEPESLEQLGDEFGFADIARGQYVHGGVLSCARNVYRDLKQHGSLDYLLTTKFPHYQLRLVGHSLGAATSTLLGFMLRQTYPTLRCYNYSPPGCTLTWNMAIQCQSWCTSFVLDCEIVPRLSFEALEYLRDEVLDLIGRIKVSKIEVARKLVSKTLWCRDNRNTVSSPTAAASPRGLRGGGYNDVEIATSIADEIGLLLDELLLPAREGPPSDDAAATSYRQQLLEFQSIQSERRQARGTRRTIRLFPPGKILHLLKTDEEQNCMVNAVKCVTCCMSNAGSLYTPVWIGNGDLNEIVISPTMGTDHFPDRMVEELNGIVRSFGVAPQYR